MGKEKKCVIIGASPEYDNDFILCHAQNANYVICVDGGFAVAHRLGIKVDLVIGDFDSSPAEPSLEQMCIKSIKLPKHKDDTDMMAAVKFAIKNQIFSKIILLGATGGRFDHTYANICVLKYLLNCNVDAKILDKSQEIFLLKSSCKYHFDNKIGQTVSIFPFGCNCVKVKYHGFEYGSECTLTCDSPIGISNVILKKNSYIYIENGCGLINLVSLDSLSKKNFKM